MSDTEILKSKLQERENEIDELRKEFLEYLTLLFGRIAESSNIATKDKLASMKKNTRKILNRRIKK